MTTENLQELKSLVRLLEDPDEAVFQLVSAEILQRGTLMLPLLEEGLTEADPVMQDRILQLSGKIQFSATCHQLEKWVAVGSDNLLLGALIVAKYQYPNLKEETIIRRLGHITQDIYLRIKDQMTPIEKIMIINRVLYDEYEFFGNKRDYQTPPNFFLNTVIDTGKGNHLSLGILYILVAQSLGIPVVGIDLENYFFLAYQEDERLLFFINPFSRGNTLTHNELVFFLKLAEVEVAPGGIRPATFPEILRRLVMSLMEAYRKLGKEEKADDMQTLLKILLST
ncbi:MAG TPA: transglutaminase-like domain-containing protein [Bacteroidales bacterium]|nr:transglutaminase-like domain-containing protein [Bacteroidales bacterium]HRZ48848.1 transglutaminase-like domain-containing protein [Bacteroidales bacterium]